MRGAEEKVAPCWVLEVLCGESLPWPTVSRLICPPSFSHDEEGVNGAWQYTELRIVTGRGVPRVSDSAGVSCELH